MSKWSQKETLFDEVPSSGHYCIPDDVQVSSIFIDESGSKNSKGGFFVLGFIKARDCPKLTREIRSIRQKHKFFDEIKFGEIKRENEFFYFDLVEMVAASDIRLGGSIYDSQKSFSPKIETWREQAKMSARLIVGNVNKGEIVNAFLDLVQTPAGCSVAAVVHETVNKRLGNKALVACYDMDSRATDLLQVADLVAGSIAYEKRQWAGEVEGAPREEKVPKARVSGRLRRALGLDSFNDIQWGKVNILTMRN